MKNKKLYNRLIIAVLIIITIILSQIIKLPQGEIVLVKADKSPKKIRPKDPGGIIMPNADSLVYDQLKHIRNEKNFKINKEPEKAMDLGFLKFRNNNLILDPIDEILNNLDFYEKQSQKNHVEESDDYIMPQKLNKKPVAKVTKDDYDSKLEITRSNDEDDSSIFKERFSVRDLPSKGYKLHLVTANTEMQAHKDIKTINNYNPKILDKKNIIIKKNYSKKGKIYYDVIASPFPTLDEAQHVCRNLNRVHCVVIW